MDYFNLKIGKSTIPTYCGYDCQAEIADRISSLTNHAIVVFDEDAFPDRGKELRHLLEARVRVSCLFLKAGEELKRLRTVESLLDRVVAEGADHASVFVAVGGGLVGNIAGTAAALLFRGVRLVHVPTTLLAMSDSVFSQKQAVNGISCKNMYGTYHLPAAICIDTAYLHTLPREQLSAGFVELCKNGLAIDSDVIPRLVKCASSLDRPECWLDLVSIGFDTKQRLLLNDPFEKREGLALEYGHTVGHAIELAHHITHGHAVGLGMLVAARIARARGWLSADEEALHERLLTGCGAPVRLFSADIPRLVSLIRGDNKRGRIPLQADEFAFVLLQGIGRVAESGALPLCAVREEELVEAFSVLTSGQPNFKGKQALETV